jgi:succinate dehydrogenase / fumarate reductase flavoprotein subunit
VAGQAQPLNANWAKHVISWFDDWGGIRLDYRPAHDYMLGDDIDYIKPKPRVY